MLSSRPMDIRYRIQGGVPLMGDVTISGSKTALPLYARLCHLYGESRFSQCAAAVGHQTMIAILKFWGESHLLSRIRSLWMPPSSSISLFLDLVSRCVAPLFCSDHCLPVSAASKWRIRAAACWKLASGVNGAHSGIRTNGCQVLCTDNTLCWRNAQSREIVLPEFSVTATECHIGRSAHRRRNNSRTRCSRTAHVQDVAISWPARGHGHRQRHAYHHRSRQKKIGGGQHTVISDYRLHQAGAFVIAGLVTRGRIAHSASTAVTSSHFECLRADGRQIPFRGSGVLHVRGNRST